MTSAKQRARLDQREKADSGGWEGKHDLLTNARIPGFGNV